MWYSFINFHGESFAKPLRSKKQLENEKEKELIISEEWKMWNKW